MDPDQNDDVLARLEEALKRHTEVVRHQNKLLGDWRYRLVQGIMIGFGSVVGATIVVAIAIAVLRPFESIEALGPVIESLRDELGRAD